MNQSFKYIFIILAFSWLSVASAGPAKVPIDKEFSEGIAAYLDILGVWISAVPV